MTGAQKRKGQFDGGEYCGWMNKGRTHLPPGCYLQTAVYHYQGNEKTLLRIKLLNGKQVYYSQPYPGKVNATQLDTTFQELMPSLNLYLKP